MDNEELCDIIWGKKACCDPLNVVSSAKPKQTDNHKDKVTENEEDRDQDVISDSISEVGTEDSISNSEFDNSINTSNGNVSEGESADAERDVSGEEDQAQLQDQGRSSHYCIDLAILSAHFYF